MTDSLNNLVTVSGHHFELTPAITKYAEDKIKHITTHFNKITQINIVLSVEHKTQQHAKASVHLAGGDPIVASANSEDLYKSIDLLKDKLDVQITKHKEKLRKHHDGDDKIL